MNKFIIFLASLFLFASCHRQSDLKPITYKNIFTAPKDSVHPGLVINPGDSFSLDIDLGKYDFAVKRKIRIAGGCVLPSPFEKRGEENFRKFLYTIDDCLDSTVTYKQKYSLYFKGDSDSFERNTYFRLSEKEFAKGSDAIISFAAKADGLSYTAEGGLFIELQFYKTRSGIHPDDIFNEPEQKKQIPVPTGTYDWQIITEKIIIPTNTACIVMRLGGKGFSGVCRFEAPQFVQGGKPTPVSQFDKYNIEKNNWVGVNLSIKEWPMFEFSLDGKKFFSGKIFDRSSDISDIQVTLPETSGGKHSLKIKLLKQQPSCFPFLVKDMGLSESAMRDFEVAFVPEFVFAKKPFSILLETNKPDIDLEFSSRGNVRPDDKKLHFHEAGLHFARFYADSGSGASSVIVSYKGRKAEIPIRQILVKEDDGVMLATTDDIYINRNREDFSEYLVWYCREGIGNAYGFRPSYQWSGSRDSDPYFYRWASCLLQDMQMHYALMVEARSIPEVNVNPTDEVINTAYYLGRQAHENDGGFYYWGHFRYIGLFSDLFAQMRPYGGIFAKTPVKKTDKGTFVYFDPYASKNMKDGNELFIKNVGDAKGKSTRHTGPTVMFRNMLQAGYNWVGAEQMYGPEDVILSSLRGACKAYGKKSYGTHLATQWGSGPFDAPEHATRLFLSLAVSYMHGADHINTEDGLWTTEDDHNRFTREGKEHIAEQKKMLNFIQTHQRRGTFVAPVAIMQGRYDAWKCFVRNGSAWAHPGDGWQYGPAEFSFDLLNVFYPNSRLDAVYKFPCPREKQGWYTGMPYGPVDLLPIEAPENIIGSYKAIAFLGWNTFAEEDFVKLLNFVKNGGTLLLARPHMNTELSHGAHPKLPQSPTLDEFLGKNYSSLTGIVRRDVGKGKVIYFASNVYPNDTTIRSDYEKELATIGENAIKEERAKGWIKGTDVVEFTAYDRPDGARTIYLLNTDWWSDEKIHTAKLLLGDKEFEIKVRRGFIETITVCNGVAVMPSSMQTDFLEMRAAENKIFLKVQTTEPDELTIFDAKGSVKTHTIRSAGIFEIK